MNDVLFNEGFACGAFITFIFMGGPFFVGLAYLIFPEKKAKETKS